MGYWTHEDFMNMDYYEKIKATKGLQEANVYATLVEIASRYIVERCNEANMKKPRELEGIEKKEVVDAANTWLNSEILRYIGVYNGAEEKESATGGRTQAIETLRKDLANNNRWWKSSDPLVRAYYQLNRALNAFSPSEVANDVVSALGSAYAPRDDAERRQVAETSANSYQVGYFKRVKDAVIAEYNKKYGSASSLNR